MASTASLTEFYLSSVWLYKPKIVKRIIGHLVGLGCEYAEFTYDDEYDWFKVICLEDDQFKINQAFGKLALEIEAEAFDVHEDDILYTNDTLILDFDNEWFSFAPLGNSSSDGADESDASYCRPGPLAAYAHSAVWNELDNNNEPYTIWDLLSPGQFDRIKKALGVEMLSGPGGKLIDIAGDSEESVHQARTRLKIMLDTKKLLDSVPRTANLLYAEGYADPPDQLEPEAAPVFDADVRYLANIDPKLVSSTLLDPAAVDDLEGSYKRLYGTASSIRLCRWNPDKKFRVSLLGPKVAVQPKDKTVWGNRPAVSTKEISEIRKTSEGLTSLGLGQTPGAIGVVETEINELPAEHGFAAGADTPALLGDQTPAGPPEMSMSESLIELADKPGTPSRGTPMATPSKTLVDSTAVGDTQISPLCPGVSATPREKLGMLSKGTVSRIQVGKVGNELAFTGDDCLIDLLAAVRTSSPMDSLQSSIQWEMPPLIPSPPRNESVEVSTGSDQVSSTSKDNPSKREGPVSPRQKDQGRSQQSTDGGKKSGSSRSGKPLGSPARGSRPVTKQSPKQQTGNRKTRNSPKPGTTLNQPAEPSSSQLENPATKQFIDEIETAMVKVLSLGPYRRGRVGFRAELGRAIIEAVDPSGLSFNSANTRSNGWKKPTLIKKLNKDYGENQNIQFTKILSTFGCDVEDMINTKVNGTRLWEQEPRRAWTTYSFHCSLRSINRLGRFIVDIDDDGTSRGIFSYSIRPHNDVFPPKQPNPIYVHAIQRNWDVRIATTHVEAGEVEMAYRPFVNTLLHSLSVSIGKTGGPEVKFAVDSTSAADVNEVRVLTKWQHISLDRKSALEITEVQQLEMKPYSQGLYSGSWDSWEGTLARPWTQRATKERRYEGEFPRWYEAAIVSLELEQLFQRNLLLQLGEKADWDPEDVKARGLLAAIYNPALEMVKAMDHVGRQDDNQMSETYGHLLRRRNDPPPAVPGSIPVQVRVRSRGGEEGVGAQGADTQSIRSGVTSGRGSSGRVAPTAPVQSQPEGFW